QSHRLRHSLAESVAGPAQSVDNSVASTSSIPPMPERRSGFGPVVILSLPGARLVFETSSREMSRGAVHRRLCTASTEMQRPSGPAVIRYVTVGWSSGRHRGAKPNDIAVRVEDHSLVHAPFGVHWKPDIGAGRAPYPSQFVCVVDEQVRGGRRRGLVGRDHAEV